MIRASLYILASAVLWLAEGFVFSRFLGFSRLQTIVMAAVYALLFAAAVRMVFVMSTEESDLPRWRVLSLGPMLVLIIGSFVSLPLMALIAVLGLVIH